MHFVLGVVQFHSLNCAPLLDVWDSLDSCAVLFLNTVGLVEFYQCSK
uniref:Uncharacterized protein n=1 Tax=Arundo donax TaxID=35708 RepID=A0A0A9HH09_ARUDO